MPKIIASMTSYPGRIKFIAPAIESILNQTRKPDKVVLWLNRNEFKDTKIPRNIMDLRARGGACGVRN